MMTTPDATSPFSPRSLAGHDGAIFRCSRAPFLAVLLCGCALTLLSACATQQNPDTAPGQKPAITAEFASKSPQEALRHYEALHKKNRADADAALGYAQALRRTGNPDKALRVIDPFLKKRPAAEPVMVLEAAASAVAGGQIDRGAQYAQKILQSRDAAPFHAQARHLLGTALAMQGRHKDAEKEFRAALDVWQGDPAPVMNNLALSLAQQGFLDEALGTLRRAREMSPDSAKIDENIAIVMELRKALVPVAQ